MFGVVPRKPRTTTYTRTPSRGVGTLRTTKKRKTFYRSRYSKKPLPARLRGSRINYQINKAVSRAVNGLAENKIVALTNVNESPPSPIQLLALATTRSFTLGSIPTAWSSIAGLTSLSGMTFIQGAANNQRVGKYIYLQKTRVSVEIDMFTNASDSVPIEFRVICCKARRGNNPSGITNDFSTSLFLATNGNDFGHATSGINGTDLMVQPINKKDWAVFGDRKFMLSNPAVAQDNAATGSTTYYSGKYPVMKRMVFSLPFNTKTEIATNPAEPADLDYNYVLVIYARSLSKDLVADKFEINVRGSTTFKDL